MLYLFLAYICYKISSWSHSLIVNRALTRDGEAIFGLIQAVTFILAIFLLVAGLTERDRRGHRGHVHVQPSPSTSVATATRFVRLQAAPPPPASCAC